MAASFKPDPAARLAALEREVAELTRSVRRGKAAPNLRDLADADLTKVADGEVPIYDAASGRWLPGTAGAGPLVAVFDSQNIFISNRQRWGSVYASTDHSWFEVPSPDYDATYVKILTPGVLYASYRWDSTGVQYPEIYSTGPGAVLVTDDTGHTDGSIAASEVIYEDPDPGDVNITVRSLNTGFSVFGQLTLVFWPGFPMAAAANNAWAWEDTAGW